MKHDKARALIQRQFEEGPLEMEEGLELREHIRGCEACKKLYDRLSVLESSLSAGELVNRTRVERLRSLGPPQIAEAPPAKVLRPLWPVLAPLLATAAALLLFVSIPSEQSKAPQPRGSTAQAGQSSWIKISLEDASQQLRPLEEKAQLQRGRPLVFRYSTMKHSAAAHLMIVGLDAKGRAHWFHPAYRDVSESPQSISIQRGRQDVPLKEAVFVEPALGLFKICGIFTEEPLQVKTVDQQLEKNGAWPQGGLDCHTLEVVK